MPAATRPARRVAAFSPAARPLPSPPVRAADVSRAVARVTRDSCHARTQAGAGASGTPPSAQRSRMASVCLQGNLRLGQVHL